MQDRPPGPDSTRSSGDPALDQFFLEAYDELLKIARGRLRRSETITLLDTTSLVHECYVRFSRAGQGNMNQGAEFIAYAARTMRTVVVDFVRRRRTQRRGLGEDHEVLGTGAGENIPASEDEILNVHEALADLAKTEPRLAQVVELRYFGGLNETQIAQCLGVTDRTVRRDWEKARLLLRVALTRR